MDEKRENNIGDETVSAAKEKKQRRRSKRRADSEKGSEKRGFAEFFSLKERGIILSFFLMVSQKLSDGFRNGVFGKIFSSLYQSENYLLKNGFIGNAVAPLSIEKSERLRLRTKISSLYERSLFCRIISIIVNWLIHSYIRLWGVFLVSVGIMIDAVFVLRMLTEGSTVFFDYFLIGIGIIAASVPLLLSSRRLGEALLNGKLTRHIVLDVIGFNEESVHDEKTGFGGYYSIAFLVGALLGLGSYFVHPVYYLYAVLLALLFAVVMSVPEAGLMLTIVSVPFMSIFSNPSIALVILVGTDFIAFLFKWIRGKRVVRIELVDIFVFIFALFLLLGGLISAGGIASVRSSLLYFGFMLSYFLVVNMLRKRSSVERAIKLVVFSASMIAIIGIFEQGKGTVNPSWIDTVVFSEIGTRVTSLFDNPNMLSIYLILAFPFVLGEIVSVKTGKERLMYLLCAASILVCTVFTWSRGAWLGLVVSVCIFLLAYNIKTIWALLLAFISMPLWSMLIPSSVIERAVSIGSVTDSSTFYRLYTWKGVFRMLKDCFFSGIGTGEGAFREVFPIYSYAGTEYVMHSHSLYLEIAVQLGIVGLLIFAAIMFFFGQKCFGHIKTHTNSDRSRIIAICGVSSISGALVMGLTDHIWYNYRVFLFFWIVIGITCASIKISNRYDEKKKACTVITDRAASMDIKE